MPYSANFSSLFELRPLAEDLTPIELHGLLPLFAASAPALKLKVGNRIGSHFVSNKLTHYCRLTVFDEIPHLPKTDVTTEIRERAQEQRSAVEHPWPSGRRFIFTHITVKEEQTHG